MSAINRRIARRLMTAGVAAWSAVCLSIAANAQGVAPIPAPPAAASEQELSPDRPDFTESSDVVSRATVQFESGVTYEGDVEGGVRSRSLTVPGGLLRLGLGHRSELRLSGDGLSSETVQNTRTSGYSDIEIGAKLRLFDQRQIGVDLAVLPLVSLPTGADGITSGGVDPTLKVAWARSLPGGIGVSGNVNAASVSDEAGRFHREAVSVSVGRDLVAGFGGFAEVFALSRVERDSDAGVSVDAGVAHPIGDNLQVDVAAGRGVTAAAPDWFMGLGITVRGRLARSPRAR
jgi:hypothetical protein